MNAFLNICPRPVSIWRTREDTLLPEVKSRLSESKLLGETVSLLGEIPYAKIGDYYNSADFFVQGSAKEGSGIALLDALACGVIPIVTDIPAFRTITGQGQIGTLWPVGDTEAFVTAFFEMADQPLFHLSRKAREYFDAHWSFEAIGRHAVEIYDDVLERTRAKS